MTETDPARLRTAARDHYRQVLAAGTAPSGAELGRQFGMSARWGSARAREANQHPTGTPANGTGTHALADAMPIGTPGHAGPADGTPPDTRCVPAHTTEPGDVPTVVPVAAASIPAMPVDAEAGWQRVRTAIRWVTTLAVIVVAACAARASYDHQRRSWRWPARPRPPGICRWCATRR
jgi:hypothetical protein